MGPSANVRTANGVDGSNSLRSAATGRAVRWSTSPIAVSGDSAKTMASRCGLRQLASNGRSCSSADLRRILWPVTEDVGGQGVSGDAPESGEVQPTAPQRPSDVFLSYASQDKAIADAVCEALERACVGCWIAPRDVMPGEFYADAIVRALNETRVLVLVLTANAVASPHVLREVERTSAKRHAIVSLRLTAVSLPPALEYFLSASHWLDAGTAGIDSALPRLVESVRRLIAPPLAAAAGPVDGAEARAADLFPTPPAGKAGRRPSLQAVAVTAVIAALLAYAGFSSWRLARQATSERPVVAAAPSADLRAPAIAEKSVAVLPFVDMSESKDQEYFADGLAEELIDLLTKVPDLRVPARTSSFYFKGRPQDIQIIARRLMVAHVLEGSVRTSGKSLRITVQLVRADSGYHLWSQTYDRQLGDVFKIQDEIAAGVVQALKLSLLTAQVPHAAVRDAGAHSLLLQGRFLGRRNTREDREKSIELYRRALALDPDYAKGWAWLSTAYAVQVVYRWAPADVGYRRAREAAQRALALDPDLADAHAALAYVYEYADWDWAAAGQELKRALALDPDNVRVLNMNGILQGLVLGHIAEAETSFRRAVAADPLSPGALAGLASMLWIGGNAAEAERLYRELAAFATPDYLWLALLAVDRGDKNVALADAQRERDPGLRLMALAIVYSALGDRTAADHALAELTDKHPDLPFEIAEVHARRGEPDAAFAWLEQALARHDAGMMMLKTRICLRPLHGDRRFATLLRRMKLPED
jgi:TolB-like protein